MLIIHTQQSRSRAFTGQAHLDDENKANRKNYRLQSGDWLDICQQGRGNLTSCQAAGRWVPQSDPQQG